MIALARTTYRPIGLSLGPRSATLVQLSGRPGAWDVHALAQGELPVRENASPEEQDEETAAALRRLLADHHFKGRQVVGCLGAPDLFVQNMRLPPLPPEEIAAVVRVEAEERLPWPAADAEIRHMQVAKVRQEANVKQEVILLACQRATVERQARLLEQAGLTPLALDIEPCAVLRPLMDDGGGPDRRRAWLNLGDKSSGVIFTEGDQMLFLKYIASGGYHFDLAVARHMGLHLTEAAMMRATVTAAVELDPDDDIHRSIIDAIRHPLEAMAAEIELCLRYYKVTFRGKPLDSICITGSEASAWLAEFLASRLGVPCRLGNPFDALALSAIPPAARERPGRWTTALGLSMKEPQ